MGVITKKIKGTEDVLPKDSYRWQFVEDVMRKESAAYGFKEIRTPVFEHTELFARGVGQTTDVVQKEMYTFDTKGGESVTLRPEGTAGAARAVLEHGLVNDSLPIKASYFVSCYRYEKPQAGRLREFHQFGLECYGTQSPVADAELICAAQSILTALALNSSDLKLILSAVLLVVPSTTRRSRSIFTDTKTSFAKPAIQDLKKSYENTRLQKSRMFKDCTGRT